MTAGPISWRVVRLIAGNSLAEMARQKLPAALVLVAAGLVLGVRGLQEFNFGMPELKFMADFGFGALAVPGLILTVLVTAQTLLGEVESRTALTLLAKPVSHADFVVGKLLAVLALTGAFCASVTALLFLMLGWRAHTLVAADPELAAVGVGHLLPWGKLAVVALAQWLKLSVLAAAVLLIASFARSLLYTVTTGFLVLAIGQLQHFALEAATRAGGGAGGWLTRVGLLALPDFQTFELLDQLDSLDALRFAGVVAYAGAYLVGYTALAAYAFRRREI